MPVAHRHTVRGMTVESKFLVLAGTREAISVLNGLADLGVRAVAAVPEPEGEGPAVPALEHIGRFDGTEHLSAWMTARGITHVIDAGHPFEAGQSHAAALACAQQRVPILRVLRPSWIPETSDKWIDVSGVAEAADQVPKGARVLANTGRETQAGYARFEGEVLFLRRLQPSQDTAPFNFMQYRYDPPPYSEEREADLFEKLRIDHLIVRNVGGAASRPKLVAARKLGITVLMIRRPDPPDVAHVETADAAIAWALAR